MSGFFARHLHRIDRIFLKLNKGRMTLTHYLSGLPVIILTTIGARSGLPRTMPLACIPVSEEPGSVAVVASNLGQPHHPGWYYNLKAHPRITGTIDRQARTYVAHEANGEEYDRLWTYALIIYPGFKHYQLRVGNRRIPIMVLVEEKPHPE
jgi:deazaflavin-dependent oxidoreductase (nitroreductase family)